MKPLKFPAPGTTLTRRDFLKLAGAAPLAALAGKKVWASPRPVLTKVETRAGQPNVIIVVFDAMSARHLSLYGYRRQTSPNLERLAQRSTVYHKHYAAGNFTTPSTASLFTGVYPWSHRAFSLGGLISRNVQANNLFSQLQGAYRQTAFTQNLFVDALLYQYEQHLEKHLPLNSFSLSGSTFYNRLFQKDAFSGLVGYDRFLFDRNGERGSFFFAVLDDLAVKLRASLYERKLAGLHPDGLPQLSSTDIFYLNKAVMDGVMGFLDGSLSQAGSPGMAYIHLMAPHEPYRPTGEFIGRFDDGWAPPAKEKHRLAPGGPEEELNERRQSYDEYIANIDAEFGRLLEHLEQRGLLDESYLMVTSDHGELFERGVAGHNTPLVFEGIIRIPLLVHAPGQSQRQDVHSLTSTVDLLPTLVAIAGGTAPEWCEGRALPGSSGAATAADERSVFVVEAKKNPAHAPLREATVAVVRGDYKLVRYFGYRALPNKYEFYDLKNDPEELVDLHPEQRKQSLVQEMKDELEQKLKEANQVYWE
ncbi:MAG: sulfatase-like hydrolase/transferase [Chloroflexota bacterium]